MKRPRGTLWRGAANLTAGYPGIGKTLGWSDVSAPAGWGWTLPITIEKNGSQFRAKAFDITSYKPAVTKTYYVSKSGNDGNSGADLAHAKRNIYTVIGYGDADLIYIDDGVWDRIDGAKGTVISRSCSIIALGSACVLSDAQSGLTWTLTSGKTYTYQATRNNVSDVLDMATLTANGDYTRLTGLASVNAVEAAAGSWYCDGTYTYVHTSDNRAPDANILVMLAAYTLDFSGNITVYLEGLNVIGGTSSVRVRASGAGQTPKLYAKNCQFNYCSGSSGNGLTLLGVTETILQNCTAKCNRNDGFNGHIDNSIIPKMLLINCTGRDNGEAGDEDNGATVHDGGYLVLVGGSYYRNKGPNVIPSAAYAWCLGTLAYSSTSGTAGAKTDFNSTGGSGSMWLDTCINTGSTSTYSLYADTGTTIYTRNNGTTGTTAGGGTITTY